MDTARLPEPFLNVILFMFLPSSFFFFDGVTLLGLNDVTVMCFIHPGACLHPAGGGSTICICKQKKLLQIQEIVWGKKEKVVSQFQI